MASELFVQAIVLGGSAGVIDALSAILPALPSDYPLPVALVVHIPPDKPSLLPNVLRWKCNLRVKEAEDKEPLAPATLYVAPPNYHLLIERDRCLALSDDGLVNFSRPSIDVLFESAADAYGPELAGVLLTGANGDGARGLLAIKQAGGTTIVQAPATSPATAMPEAALRLGAADYVRSPREIGALLRGVRGGRIEGAEVR